MINLLKEYQVFVYGFLFGNYTTILCVLHRELKYCHNVNDKSKCLKKKTLKAKQQYLEGNTMKKMDIQENPHGLIADFSGKPPYARPALWEIWCSWALIILCDRLDLADERHNE